MSEYEKKILLIGTVGIASIVAIYWLYIKQCAENDAKVAAARISYIGKPVEAAASPAIDGQPPS